jgi:hypothetical protein
MTNSNPSPSPGSFGVPGQGIKRQMGMEGGRGKAWLARGPTYTQISTGELAAAYTRPLGCDLNSKFFFHKFM